MDDLEMWFLHSGISECGGGMVEVGWQKKLHEMRKETPLKSRRQYLWTIGALAGHPILPMTVVVTVFLSDWGSLSLYSSSHDAFHSFTFCPSCSVMSNTFVITDQKNSKWINFLHILQLCRSGSPCIVSIHPHIPTVGLEKALPPPLTNLSQPE